MVLVATLQRWAACLGMNSTGSLYAGSDGWLDAPGPALSGLCYGARRTEAHHGPLDLARRGVAAGAVATPVKMGEIL